MIADNVEKYSLSAFDIAILLLSSISSEEFRNRSKNPDLVSFKQVVVVREILFA